MVNMKYSFLLQNKTKLNERDKHSYPTFVTSTWIKTVEIPFAYGPCWAGWCKKLNCVFYSYKTRQKTSDKPRICILIVS